MLTFLVDRIQASVINGFSFHDRVSGHYSGSAVILEKEAAQAAFSPPPRDRSLSPKAYRKADRTFGRRRISPVMDSDILLQATACITHVAGRR
jgi:hypothetical protein